VDRTLIMASYMKMAFVVLPRFFSGKTINGIDEIVGSHIKKTTSSAISADSTKGSN